MISELSKEQKAKIIDHGLKWTRIGLSTEPVDMANAMMAIKEAYSCAGLKPPKAFLGPFNNPVECAKAQVMLKRMGDDVDFAKLKEVTIPVGTEFTSEELYAAIAEQTYGFCEASWLCLYDFYKELEVDGLEKIKGLVEVAKHCGWWVPYNKVALVQHRPAEIHLDANGHLHNENGPAIKWRGEDRTYDIFAIHGEVQPPNYNQTQSAPENAELQA